MEQIGESPVQLLDALPLVRSGLQDQAELRGVLEQSKHVEPDAEDAILEKIRQVVTMLYEHEVKEHALVQKLMRL